MKENKFNQKKFKHYLKERLKIREHKNLHVPYFDKLDSKYKINESIETGSFVYSATDIAKNELLLYKIIKINDSKKFADVISHDYGFSSFHFESLALVPEEILHQKHNTEIKDSQELIKEDKEKRKNIKRK